MGGANLRGADLYRTNLRDANLSGADLSRAYLRGVPLHGAHLRGANLHEAKVTLGQLAQAASLEGATLPDGTLHTLPELELGPGDIQDDEDLSDRGDDRAGGRVEASAFA